MPNRLLPTTVVGSYPQPDWLIDRVGLGATVPRIRRPELWRVAEPFLATAQDDATILAIRDMERAGIDVITDGEMRRESYSNRLASSLEGIDMDNPATIIGRVAGKPVTVPRVVGRVRRTAPVEVDATRFLRANTDRTIKVTMPGPFTMAKQAKNEFYDDPEEMVMDFAAAVNEEAKAVKAAGADVIQIDEPWFQSFPEDARRYGIKGLDRALQDLAGPTAVHLCFGYAHLVKKEGRGVYAFLPELADAAADQISIEAAQPHLDLGVLSDLVGKTVILGVIDLGTNEVESADEVADRIRAALQYLPPNQVMPAPDCGMKYLTRETAFQKLCALSEGAARVRKEQQDA
jgi:5-methyltetrahydropteroyltriglutamate--homocysteine methyltransferase